MGGGGGNYCSFLFAFIGGKFSSHFYKGEGGGKGGSNYYSFLFAFIEMKLLKGGVYS